ncbi:hypothetical protein AN958_09695 [Leucoagaricus sp. SymC.cos]|nr:hypothetical protein AN958_09695 [Leucoagaricus sp. SymC.cos]
MRFTTLALAALGLLISQVAATPVENGGPTGQHCWKKQEFSALLTERPHAALVANDATVCLDYPRPFVSKIEFHPNTHRSTQAQLPNSPASSRKGRQLIAQETLDQSKAVIKECVADGATEDSAFYSEQLPPLPPLDKPGVKRPVLVVNSDSFTAARKLFDEHADAKGSVSVLNLASDERIAGGWLHSLSRTQEEALCYSSTLYVTLKPSWYPWPNLGPGSVAGGFSPGVVVFKDDLDYDCVDLPKEQWRVLSVITVAAPRLPKLTADGESFANESDLEDLRGKIRLVYRMAAHNKQRHLILGAMGCGVYACPPKLVAQEMKTILLDQEFKNYFDRVVFAVYSKDGNGNFEVFSRAFKGVEV